ncbi:BTAD domain-containing putative transcriptional regulator [Streptomyces sp. R11]|uniref:BTAD domain-containing putative transcriptional regulator n=1 Tax=Streptomyces sp. R11 TaxID=3238625 RepID=A0AB39NAR1_9ACTN
MSSTEHSACSSRRPAPRAEALQAYQNLYAVLRRELGLEPSQELQWLQADILNASTDGPLLHRCRPKAISSPAEFTPLWDSAVAS